MRDPHFSGSVAKTQYNLYAFNASLWVMLNVYVTLILRFLYLEVQIESRFLHRLAGKTGMALFQMLFGCVAKQNNFS